ncbi:MAG: metallophosphoesterase [Candidatus Limiplasma sp.]|nr:metallophosphoesterase [Candidatus Limiplasma sp.]
MPRYPLKYRKPPRRRVRFSRVFMFLVLLAMIVYPFWEASRLTVEERTVQVANLHPNLKGMRIVFASDIHEGAFFSHSRVVNLINTINGLSPDLVLLGGDYAEDSAGAIEFFRTAPPIQARLGVFGVVGNHDRTEPESNFSLLVGQMTKYGCLPLTNNVARVKVGQTYAYIAGVDDFYNGYPDVAGVASQVSKDDFVIFVGHTPDLLPAAFAAKTRENDNHWFDLALFGHTHGGQVTLFGQPLIPKLRPEIGLRYLSGWREENRASILISNGVGTSNFPARLFATPQIHLITLKSK